MLRRRTPKNKPVAPEPKEPSTIPEASAPATPDADIEATPEKTTAEPVVDDTAADVSPDTSEAIETSSDVLSTEDSFEEKPAVAEVHRSLPEVEGRAAKLPNMPSKEREVPFDSTPRRPAPRPPAPERPTHDRPAGSSGIAGSPETADRASHLPNVPKSPPTPTPSPPEAVAAAATAFGEPAPPAAPEAPEEGDQPTGTTPPASAIRLRTETRAATLTGGIDLGGTKIAAAVIGPKHEVLAYRRRPTPTTGGPGDVVKAMAITMQEAAQDAGVEAHQLRAVGVGSPGSVDSATGSVAGAGNLPGWGGSYPLGTALRDILGTPVFVGNDVQVGTNAEFLLGAGAGYRSLLGVFWGTGVGGGIVLDGKPWRGRGRAGEIGHTLVKRGGAPNSNGLNGTVEAYAGRKAMQAKVEREIKKGRKTDLFKIMEKHGKTNLTSAVWAHALDHDDELATELLNRAVKALSAGIASAVNLLDVEAVVIGGGLGVRFGDTLVPEIIDGMNAYLLDADNPPAVKVAGLGDEGGVIGAALLV